MVYVLLSLLVDATGGLLEANGDSVGRLATALFGRFRDRLVLV